MKYEDFKAVCKWLQTEQVSLDLNEDEIKQEYSLFKAENKAINYTRCCKSDSEQLSCEHEWVKPIINAENRRCLKCGVWEEKET